jgi:hypothetical protein
VCHIFMLSRFFPSHWVNLPHYTVTNFGTAKSQTSQCKNMYKTLIINVKIKICNTIFTLFTSIYFTLFCICANSFVNVFGSSLIEVNFELAFVHQTKWEMGQTDLIVILVTVSLNTHNISKYRVKQNLVSYLLFCFLILLIFVYTK